MKKASKILLTISGIVYLIAAIGLIITGIVFAIMAFVASASLPSAELASFIEEFVGDMELDEQMVSLIISVFLALIYFAGFLAGFILCLIVSIVSFKGAKAEKKGVLIANIVFGVIAENVLGIVGAILGIIALSKEQNAAQSELEPAPAPAPAPAKAIEEKKPEPEPVKEEPKAEAPKAREDWFCPNCGAHNTGKFCQSCGTKRPE